MLNFAQAVRQISGFGGKGFRMKELLLDLAEVTKGDRAYWLPCRALADILRLRLVFGPISLRRLLAINGDVLSTFQLSHAQLSHS